MKKKKPFKEYYQRTSYETGAENFPYVLLLGIILFGGIWLADQVFHFLK